MKLTRRNNLKVILSNIHVYSYVSISSFRYLGQYHQNYFLTTCIAPLLFAGWLRSVEYQSENCIKLIATRCKTCTQVRDERTGESSPSCTFDKKKTIILKTYTWKIFSGTLQGLIFLYIIRVSFSDTKVSQKSEINWDELISVQFISIQSRSVV